VCWGLWLHAVSKKLAIRTRAYRMVLILEIMEPLFSLT
jgi:hypothetical protein